MTSTLQTILPPNVVTRVVSRVASTSDWLQVLFGMQPGGPNESYEGHGRNGAYTIFNNARAVAQGRAPGTAHATRAQQAVGVVPFVYPRMHDSIPLLAETLHNIGRVDNPAVREGAMQDMIGRQERYLGQLASNWRKALLVGTLRDSLYIDKTGDNEFVTFTSSGAEYQVPTQMPAGNKGQLDMLGAGDIIDASWATATTNIPKHLNQIDAAFQQLCGGYLAAVICGSNVWDEVVDNDHVAAGHGIANTPFETLTVDSLDTEVGRTMESVMRAKLKTNPKTTFYVTDEGLEVGAPGSETYTKIVDDNDALFIGFTPNGGVMTMMLGSEPIAEHDGAPEVTKVGLSAWMYKQSNPTRTNLVALDNALPVNHIPKSIAKGTVIF